ncbi:MAG: diguanylate cyclase domain-containing protein [Candidatus Rokuibacteriota bacterium]
MYVRFWGTRGSIATPGLHTARYGGNTACVEVRATDGTILVLDCGTGARELGLKLAHESPLPRLHLLIGHTHWDHIQGFPFFVPAFLPGAELNIYAPLGFQRGLEEAMAGQMEYSYFPVKLRDLRSRIHFTELDEGFFRIGDVLVETQYLNHTAPTIAYRISDNGATLAYVTDHEPFWQASDGVFRHPGDQHHVAFLQGADLVIHDAQYTEEEYRSKIGWGHSTVVYATDAALAAGVRRLALFHHDPIHDDAAMERLEADARARVVTARGALDVFAAREGIEIDLTGSGQAPSAVRSSALHRRSVAGGRVLVISASESDIAAIGDVLADDDLLLVRMADGKSARAGAADIVPDLAIVDMELPDGDGLSLVPSLREATGRPDLPIIVLVDLAQTERLLGLVEESIDVLPKPFSPPMLRARIRAWLARTLPDPEGHTARRRRREARGVRDTISPESYADALWALPLFRSLTRDERQGLVAEATDHNYLTGQDVIREGESGDKVYVVLSGRVRVMETAHETQAELFLGELGPGDIFGELGILRDQPRSATVVAVEPTLCLIIPQRDFLRALRSAPGLSIALLRTMAARLFDADRRLSRYAPDPLTGLASRRAFHDQYRRLAASARRRRTGALMLLLDVPQLNAINARFGYTVGDDVLRSVADALMETTRATDLVGRCGSDEFAALLVDARPSDVGSIAERVNAKLAEMARKRELPIEVTVHLGVAFSEAPPETAEELLREADHDMRARKPHQPS